MTVGVLAAFWVVSVLLALVPGADWAYAIAAGLRDRSLLPAVGGLVLGYVLLTGVVAGGVAALVARSPGVLTGLTVTGALYLVGLGVLTVLRPGTPGAGPQDVPTSSVRRVVTGAGVSGFNPKALLLFLALLPQFSQPDGGWPFGAQIAVLGLVHAVDCGLVYLVVGSAARRVLRTRPAVARTVTRCSGVAMIVLGAVLAVERFVG